MSNTSPAPLDLQGLFPTPQRNAAISSLQPTQVFEDKHEKE